MYTYIVTLILISIFFVFSKNKKNALLASLVILTIISALRSYNVGVDTKAYVSAYKLIGLSSRWNYLDFRYEPGFYYLCKILNIFSSEPQTLIIITSIFINFSVYKFVKKHSKNYFLSIILYVIMNIFFSFMNIMREAIAVCIILYGYDYLLAKKHFNYFLVILLASLFHTSAFAALILLFYALLPKKKIFYFSEIIISIITFIFYSNFFNLISSIFGYSNYANGIFGLSNYFGSLLVFLECFMVFSLLYFIAFSGRKNEYDKNKIHILSVITIIYLWFEFLTLRMVIFNRLYGIYAIYSIISIPELLYIIKTKSKFNYSICLFATLTIFLSSFLIIGFFRPEWYETIPYYFYWQVN